MPFADYTLQAAIRQLPDRVVIKDTHSRFITCNQRFADDLGISIEDIAGKTDYDFFPPALAASYQADDQKVIASGVAMVLQEPYMLDGSTAGWKPASHPFSMPQASA
jgi:PAS domain-containing protein